jgi:hypothetical protein
MPVDMRSKGWFCGLSLAGIVGFNLTRGMDVVSVVYFKVEVSVKG